MNIQNISSKPRRAPTLEETKELQNALLEHRCDMPEAEHLFAPGTYTRKLVVPAGMRMVGKTHKHAHVLMVLKGRAIIIDQYGESELLAGHLSISKPGIKRVVSAIEETTFVTVHHNPTDTTDLEQIEKDNIEDEGFKIEYHRKMEVLS